MLQVTSRLFGLTGFRTSKKWPMKMKQALFSLLALLLTLSGFAQNDSCRLRISLLTCSPGEELYSSFGHTALRVTDSAAGNDIVFNYGTFDDSDPQFYMKFTKGIMIYELSVYPYADFFREYQMQQRGVIEQVLDLNCTEKTTLFKALLENAKEQNRSYQYYFHTDNCTTRARDMVKKSSAPLMFRNILPAEPPTFRKLIHSYLNNSGQYWSKFGIDILLGSTLDEKVTNESAMFLPDYLMKGFDSATVQGRPLVSDKQTVLTSPGFSDEAKTWITPFIFFMILLVVMLGLSWKGRRWSKATLNFFDTLLFLSLGLLGVLLLTLWIIRVDNVCRDNWNLLWALPTHLPAAFLLWTNKRWVKVYFGITAILTLLFAAAWIFLPQQLNPAVAPILGIILLRSLYRSVGWH